MANVHRNKFFINCDSISSCRTLQRLEPEPEPTSDINEVCTGTYRRDRQLLLHQTVTTTLLHQPNPRYTTNLIEKIVRTKIYNSTNWKEQCFGLRWRLWWTRPWSLTTSARPLEVIENPHRSFMKMLQMQPKKEIVIEFIKNDDYEKRNWFAIFCCWWKVIADK